MNIMKNIISILFLPILLISCSSDNEEDEMVYEINTELNFTEVFTIQVDTLDLDMASSVNANSIYITYSGDSGLNENVLKYNSTTQVQSYLTHPDTSQARQIEIIANNIYSIAIDGVYKFDLNLNNVVKSYDNYTQIPWAKTTSVNNKILVLNHNKILKFNTTSETYDFSSTNSPFEDSFKRDGEFYNDNLYIFGGTTYANQTWPDENVVNSSDAITIYNLSTDTWSQNQNLPFGAFETFTAIIDDSIIVAGNKNQDLSNPFIGIYDIISNNYTEFNNSLLQSNISIRGITILNSEIYVAYVELISSMPDLMTVKVAKASLL